MHMVRLVALFYGNPNHSMGKSVSVPWIGRLLALALLVFLGWLLLHPAGALGNDPLSPGKRSAVSAGGGQGAGGRVPDAVLATVVTGLCNPFDPSCYTNAVGQYLATQILGALKPVANFFQNSSANILTQTPANDSYANPMVIKLNGIFVAAVDGALACLLLIGGYTVIVGRHLSMQHSSVTELLPRALLVVAAVHFNLTFLAMFIDLNNALCSAITAAASAQTLTNVISSFLSINPLAGLLLVILVIVLLIMAVLLLFQMIVRIALIALLIVLAPLGLACFALPQTMRWGRLWITTFSSAVLVQFLQVTALGLGGMFLTSVGSTFLGHVGQEIGTVLLAIGTMVLVLKIPGMLQTWALHPMMDASNGGGEGGGDTGSGTVGDQAGGGEMSMGSSSITTSSTTMEATQAPVAAEAAAIALL